MRNIFLAMLFLLSPPAFAQKNLAQHTNDDIDSLKRLLSSAKEDTIKVNLLNELSSACIFVYADLSVHYAKQGLQLAEKMGYTKGKFLNIYNLVLGLSNLGKFKEALDYGIQGMQLAQNLKDTPDLSWMYLALLVCYREQEDYKEALTYGYRSKQISRSEDSVQRAVTFGDIASVHERSD